MDKLISIGQILDQSIDHYAKFFKDLMKFSLWFLIITALFIIAGLMLPLGDVTALAVENFGGWWLVGSIIMVVSSLIVAPIVSLWIYLSLVETIDKERLNQVVDHKAIAKMSWKKFLPYAWVVVLRTLVLLIPALAIVPGLILIVVNLMTDGGVWLGTMSILLTFLGTLVGLVFLFILAIQLNFVGFSMILENNRGSAALKNSRRLVKGRFWHTFVRLLIPKIVFTAALVISQFILFSISSPIIAVGIGNSGFALHLADVINNLISGGLTVLSLPLFIIADYLIYDSLRKTKK